MWHYILTCVCVNLTFGNWGWCSCSGFAVDSRGLVVDSLRYSLNQHKKTETENKSTLIENASIIITDDSNGQRLCVARQQWNQNTDSVEFRLFRTSVWVCRTERRNPAGIPANVEHYSSIFILRSQIDWFDYSNYTVDDYKAASCLSFLEKTIPESI